MLLSLTAVLHVICCVTASSIPPFAIFRSRPDLRAPVLNTSYHDAALASNEYIFASPFFQSIIKPDSGPYIFDSSGSLVWSGVDVSGGAGKTDVQGLHVCQYKDEDHLCFWKGHQRGMYGSGVGVVMNSHYETVKVVRSSTAVASTDLHEFCLTDHNTALLTVYQPVLHKGVWILDSIMQEVNLDDDTLVFEWKALEHVDPDESRVPIGSYALVGSGESPHQSWDYFHMNSIDKDAQGNYLISARHLDTIYLISRQDGSIVWSLSDSQNASFHPRDFSFRRQHHVRFREESDTRAVVSIFNNDDDKFTAQGTESTGLLIELDYATMAARKLDLFGTPAGERIVTPGMGSMDFLSNGNVLMGWGINSSFAEYQRDGSLVSFSRLPWDSWNYRVSKHKWTGLPKQPPALWGYAKTADSIMACYASWNGATEVALWNLYTSDFKEGPFELAATQPKDGFETLLTTSIYQPWAVVEAVSSEGSSLGNSSAVRTYLPPEAGRESCGLYHCFDDALMLSSAPSSEHIFGAPAGQQSAHEAGVNDEAFRSGHGNPNPIKDFLGSYMPKSSPYSTSQILLASSSLLVSLAAVYGLTRRMVASMREHDLRVKHDYEPLTYFSGS